MVVLSFPRNTHPMFRDARVSLRIEVCGDRPGFAPEHAVVGPTGRTEQSSFVECVDGARYKVCFLVTGAATDRARRHSVAAGSVRLLARVAIDGRIAFARLVASTGATKEGYARVAAERTSGPRTHAAADVVQRPFVFAQAQVVEAVSERDAAAETMLGSVSVTMSVVRVHSSLSGSHSHSHWHNAPLNTLNPIVSEKSKKAALVPHATKLGDTHDYQGETILCEPISAQPEIVHTFLYRTREILEATGVLENGRATNIPIPASFGRGRSPVRRDIDSQPLVLVATHTPVSPSRYCKNSVGKGKHINVSEKVLVVEKAIPPPPFVSPVMPASKSTNQLLNIIPNEPAYLHTKVLLEQFITSNVFEKSQSGNHTSPTALILHDASSSSSPHPFKSLSTSYQVRSQKHSVSDVSKRFLQASMRKSGLISSTLEFHTSPAREYPNEAISNQPGVKRYREDDNQNRHFSSPTLGPARGPAAVFTQADDAIVLDRDVEEHVVGPTIKRVAVPEAAGESATPALDAAIARSRARALERERVEEMQMRIQRTMDACDRILGLRKQVARAGMETSQEVWVESDGEEEWLGWDVILVESDSEVEVTKATEEVWEVDMREKGGVIVID